jgi:uncharacterized protein (TIGR02246 family)
MTVSDPAMIHHAFAEAVNAGDLDRLLSLFDDEAIVIERSGDQTSSPTAIRRHLEQLLALRPTMKIQATHAFVRADTALLCSHWTADVTTPDGAPVSLEFRGSEVARRDADGTWRLLIDNPWGVDLSG